MKSKFIKFCVLILFSCSFVLTACAGFTPSDEELDPSITDAANNATETIATKDNTTTYRDKNGKLVSKMFSDSLVFVDPGAEALFLDKLEASTDKQSKAFYVIVKDEINNLALIISKALQKFYMLEDKTVDESLGLVGLSLTLSSGTAIPSSVSKMFGETTTAENDKITNYSTIWRIASGSLDIPKKTWIDAGGNTQTDDFFNFKYAYLGGLKIDDGNYKFLSFDPAAPNYSNLNFTSKWKFLDSIIYTDEDLKTLGADGNVIIKGLTEKTALQIASSITGINGADLDTMCKSIDHLGFTEKEIKKIAEGILKNIIGETAVNSDKTLGESLSEAQLGKLITDTSETSSARNYKAYEFVINQIVRNATTAKYLAADGSSKDLFFKFPRVSIISADVNYLMDTPDYGDEEGGDPNDPGDYDFGNAGEYNPDDNDTQLTKKFESDMKIKSILFMPSSVTGKRVMARIEDGKVVYESDGSTPVKDEFDVNGFLITSAEVATVCEEGKTGSIEANYTIHSETKTIKNKSDTMDVGYVPPESTDENYTYVTQFMNETSVTTTKEEEQIKLKSGEEGALGSFRLGGYNGISLDVETGKFLNADGTETGISSVVRTSEDGKTKYYQISTALCDYIGVEDADPTDENSDSIVVDLQNFAGSNYLQVDFSMLEVDEMSDKASRDIAINICYLAIYTY